jgi:hypothetical protein
VSPLTPVNITSITPYVSLRHDKDPSSLGKI